MARAKRTERAEARRRYRATLATDPLAEDGDDADEPSATGSSQGAKRSNAAPAGKQGSSGTPERVGFLDAFKLSIRPVHVRQDIAALPWITIHTKAIWLPVLITIAATIATAATGANDMVTGLLFTYFVVFPAIGGVFIGGFLAPRASWLVGIVVGLVSAACYVALGVAGLLPPPFAEQFTVNATGAVGLRVHLLADHGRVLRRRGGLVSTLPRPVEPEPEPSPVAGPEAATRRRPDARRQPPEGPRQALNVGPGGQFGAARDGAGARCALRSFAHAP